MSFAVVQYVSLLKKKPAGPFLKAGGGCDPAVSSVSYVTISHTPGLRIRFVRFRQTVWGVVHIVTSVRQYNRSPRSGSILNRRGPVRPAPFRWLTHVRSFGPSFAPPCLAVALVHSPCE